MGISAAHGAQLIVTTGDASAARAGQLAARRAMAEDLFSRIDQSGAGWGHDVMSQSRMVLS